MPIANLGCLNALQMFFCIGGELAITSCQNNRKPSVFWSTCPGFSACCLFGFAASLVMSSYWLQGTGKKVCRHCFKPFWSITNVPKWKGMWMSTFSCRVWKGGKAGTNSEFNQRRTFWIFSLFLTQPPTCHGWAWLLCWRFGSDIGSAAGMNHGRVCLPSHVSCFILYSG